VQVSQYTSQLEGFRLTVHRVASKSAEADKLKNTLTAAVKSAHTKLRNKNTHGLWLTATIQNNDIPLP
jgi:hypothetical protein